MICRCCGKHAFCRYCPVLKAAVNRLDVQDEDEGWAKEGGREGKLKGRVRWAEQVSTVHVYHRYSSIVGNDDAEELLAFEEKEELELLAHRVRQHQRQRSILEPNMMGRIKRWVRRIRRGRWQGVASLVAKLW